MLHDSEGVEFRDALHAICEEVKVKVAVLEASDFELVVFHERECGDFFCFVNNFFSLFEPAENGAIRGGKFDDVLREGSGDDLENVVFHCASLARFPSKLTARTLRDDD